MRLGNTLVLSLLVAAGFHQVLAQTSNPAVSKPAQEERDLVPKLVFPAEGAEVDNNCKDYSDAIDWGFRWSMVTGVTQYQLNVKRTGNYPVIDKSDIRSTVYIHQSRINVVVPGNYNNWHWKVRAKINGKWGPWSDSRSFQVESWDNDCGKKREKLPR